jgi:lipopolysaccharide transport system ATP-binding protein
LGIIGPNGSGKSTTLKLLSGVLRADRGAVYVNGRQSALIELGAGFHPDLTGRENIYLNGTLLGMQKAEIDRKFDQIVDFCDLEEFLDTPVKRYSSGMYARLGFSVAAHVDPEILIVDEVLSVGDYHFQEKCFAKMKEFTQKGISLVFVSHNLVAVSSLCRTALLLRKGEPVYQGDVSTAINKYYSFYETQARSESVELLDVRLRNSSGEEREFFDPGDAVSIEITLRALSDLSGVHGFVSLQTTNGQVVFSTATSRFSKKRLDLQQGQCAKLIFTLDLNLQGDVFLLGFNITPEMDTHFLYNNPALKRIVMTGDCKSNGFMHLNPRCDVIVE